MKTSETDWNDSRAHCGGFTLLELIVVLVIISAMITVILPYATRSNQGLRLEQESLSVAEAVKYAMNLAVDSGRPTRLVLDVKNESYSVEIAGEINSLDFQPVQDIYGTVRRLGPDIHILDVDGFGVAAGGYTLGFDCAGHWPQASVSLVAGSEVTTIRIDGKRVEIENSAI
jgi:prepilin-type N-terminal cleavage/methylation domain-containing protein